MPVANRLSDMEFDEVSLVTRGANQRAPVVLFKADKMKHHDFVPDGDERGCKTCGQDRDGEWHKGQKTSVGKSEDDLFFDEYAADEIVKASIPQSTRDDYAAKGWALKDGSYPIGNKKQLASAIILAKSGHGDVKAAIALIKKRAKDLGVDISDENLDVSKAQPASTDVHQSGQPKAGISGNGSTSDHKHIKSTDASGRSRCSGCGVFMGAEGNADDKDEPEPGDEPQNMSKGHLSPLVKGDTCAICGRGVQGTGSKARHYSGGKLSQRIKDVEMDNHHKPKARSLAMSKFSKRASYGTCQKCGHEIVRHSDGAWRHDNPDHGNDGHRARLKHNSGHNGEKFSKAVTGTMPHASHEAVCRHCDRNIIRASKSGKWEHGEGAGGRRNPKALRNHDAAPRRGTVLEMNSKNGPHRIYKGDTHTSSKDRATLSGSTTSKGGSPMGADTKEKVEKVERPDSIEKVDGLPEEVVEYIEELEKAQDTLLEENESLVEDNATLAEEVENLQDQLDLDGDDEEEVTKAELAKLDPGTRRIIEKSMDRAKKAEELAKNERDARETREFISKAADFNMISTPEDLGPLLHKLSKALPEADYTAVETLLRATNDQIKEGGLFSTIGKSGESGSGNGGNGSASDIVKSKAKQLIEKSSKEGYTMEQAMLDVVLENPGLYDQYNAELRQGVK